MGTRSLTFVHEEDGTPIVCIYQQFDGYFEGVGDDILNFLKGKEVVNGFGVGDTTRQFNGAGDLACRLITHIKGGDENNIGGAYIMSPTLSDDGAGAEFAYHIFIEAGVIRLFARANYANFVVSAPVDSFVWPERDDDGNYVSALSSPNGRLQDDQRAALFATFNEVFGHTGDEARYAFTRMALGKPADAVVSWARYGEGAITVAEASKVLDALSLLNV